STGSDQRVMFPESWSSNLTLVAIQAALAHRSGKSRLDNAFVLIDGAPKSLLIIMVIAWMVAILKRG
ncbi:MAG TPA: hypothetical protein VM578_11210, partial [Candidatus Saccharimonadales bacterium]|nr:hypothetical protein [Candidatus Saccharimonadales bacterium]